MNTIRKGKIAKLPREIREQLNVRLVEGTEAEPLLAWVNGLAETQAVLQKEFDGNAITPQNLSEWRRGGHQDWLRAERQRELAEQLLEDGRDLEAMAEGPGMNERLGLVFTLELAGELRRWQSETGDPQERWRQLRQLLGELAVLRREEQRAERAKLAREQWERDSQQSGGEKPSKPELAKQPEAAPLRVKRRKLLKQNHFRRSGDWFEQEVVEVAGAFRKGEELPKWAQEALAEKAVQIPTPVSRQQAPAAQSQEKPEARNPNAENENQGNREQEKPVNPHQPLVSEPTQGLPQPNGQGKPEEPQREENQSHLIQPNPTIENESATAETAAGESTG